MAKLSSTHIYGDLSVDSAITENGQLLSSKYAAASHGTHLTLGTGSGNAYRGDYGNTAYNHSQAAHAPSNAQKNSDITKAEIEAKLTGAITTHTHAYAASSHTHNYAGSGSAGGAANSANILNINNTETKNSGRLQYFQKSNDSTIMPDTGWWSLIRTQHNGYDNGYWQEMAYAFASDTIKFRRNVNGTKSAWKTVAWTDSNITGSSGSCTGNAATATKFASAQSVALTGDVTGSASSQAGWSVATTLKNSGVTAGSYGPSANASPAHSGTFSVPYITVDAKGRVTAASTKTITLPADNNTDTKVTYTLGTTTKYYMGGPTATATGTGGITFDTGIYATTTAGQLSVGSLQTRGDITTSGNGSHAIGSTANRFSGIYGANIYSYDKNAKQYASLRLQTEGTADTQGVGRLTAGNSTNAGTAGNAKGQVLLYGTNTGYTTITPGYNDTSNITITLPSATGSLPVMSKGDTSYWGICPPDGGTGWIRTTSSGIIPSANGSGALGTSSWQFSSIYGKAIYEDGTALSSKYAPKSHTHNYAGSGSAGGTANSAARLDMSRLTGSSNSANYAPGLNRLVVKEYGNDCSNMPSNHWYHIYTGQGSDSSGAYQTQIAVGMTTTALWIRNRNNSSWGSWTELAKVGHTHNYAGSSSAGGAATSAAKLSTARTLTIGATGKSFNGSANVSWDLKEIMKGKGLTADTACNTLYYNNGGTSHVGRLSCYNDDNGDYVQVALYNTSSSKSASTLNIYANHARFSRYVIFNEYIRPNSNGSIDMGASSYRWRTVYSANGVSTTSDRTLKENIKYVRTGETEINYNDMYNFVKNDLELATYNYINSEERHINFIAQDLLANEDGTDNKVGQFIINPVPVPAKEDIENGEPYPLLSYNTNIYTSVLAGALKESIDKIEELESEKAKMQAEINELKADLTELKAIVKGLL
jgi:hypothetical protein